MSSIIIIGGGMIGATLALTISKLTHGQFPVHLVEATVPPDISSKSIFDVRTIALAIGTCQLFTQIGIWHELSKCTTAINTIHVSDKGRYGFVTIEADDYHLKELGRVIGLNNAVISLFKLIKKAPGIKLHCPAVVTKFIRIENAVSVILKDSTKITGQLLVAADGSNSFIREACGISYFKQSYNQAAIVANVSTSINHNNCAFERFTKHGPLAMLPISQGRSSLVWCHQIEKANEVLSWSDNRFCDELQKIFGWRLGRIRCTSKRFSYSLVLTKASRFISHRVVLVGNAAQTLHPISGQGFNLGLRDVIVLAEILTQAWIEQKDCGDWLTLCNYQNRRQKDKEMTVYLTDNLVRLFSNDRIPLIIGRNTGMIVTELFIPKINVLTQRVLGWIL